MKEAWQKQEEAVAKRRGGRVTRGSGNQWRHKSDVVEKGVRWEMKGTGKQSLTVKGSDLDKIESEAIRSNRMPAVHVEIGVKKNTGKPRRWVMVTEDDFDEHFPPQEG